MTKVILTLSDGVNIPQAMAILGRLLQEIEAPYWEPSTDYVLFEWDNLDVIYRLTPGGKHSITIQPKNC